jgi:ComF family protein
MASTDDMVDEAIAEKPGTLQLVRAHAKAAWLGIVDLLTPPKCLDCGVAVTQGAGLCSSCWLKQHHISEPVCDALGIPFAYDEGEGALSPEAIANPPDWNRGRAAVAFDEHSKTLLHALKYNDRHEAGLAMARMMVAAGHRLLAEADVIVPVPLHRYRLWQRRFNQSAILAREIAQATNKPVVLDGLERGKATRTQVGLDAEARRRNVKGAFSVPVEKLPLIAGKRVLLIDDVRTTGATANACARALMKAGSQQVDLLTFALVIAPARLHIEV